MVKTFILRPASPSDREKIFALSNDPEVRKNSIYGESISWTEHVTWFDSMLSNPDCTFFIAETPDGEFIGQVRFFQKKMENIVSISLCETFRARHIGTQILTEAVKEIPQRICTAYIRILNIASQKMFERAGFQVIRHVQINNQNYKVYQHEK
jgi:UDP-2,4-diacetamido-2,4,6-trideoxy-beta-L-altropyranose hydrolase